jgi:hypothetical protein
MVVAIQQIFGPGPFPSSPNEVEIIGQINQLSLHDDVLSALVPLALIFSIPIPSAPDPLADVPSVDAPLTPAPGAIQDA